MLTFSQRAKLCTNPTAQKLFALMDKKKSNLAASIDVTTKDQLLKLADEVGSEICVLKTHIDIVEDFNEDLIKELTALSKKHDFLIFEDRKFADIGNTIKLQYEKGIYHIARWASITNMHPLMGADAILGLKNVGLPLGNGLLLLAELSAKGNLITNDYKNAAVKMAKDHCDFVIGFISQHKLTDDAALIHMTPGIHLSTQGDALGQNYTTPSQAIIHNGSDIIIVGRGIYQAQYPKQAAKQYREEGWRLYQEKLNE